MCGGHQRTLSNRRLPSSQSKPTAVDRQKDYSINYGKRLPELPKSNKKEKKLNKEPVRCLHVVSPKPAFSGRLTSGSLPGQAVPSPFCQRSKDEGKLRPKFTKCEKINIFKHAAGFRPPVAMAKPKWRQILLSLTAFGNVTSKEGKPMSCACSVFIPVKRMGVCNFSPMG